MKPYQMDLNAFKKENAIQESGLTEEQYRKNKEQYGENKLLAKQQKTILDLIGDQFKSFLVGILIIAAIISIIIGEYVDGTIILVIVILNAILGVMQEKKASDALKALEEMASPKATVRRNGKIIEINSKDLTIGDIVLLETGDFIPADIRLVETVNLKIEESALTGESESVLKDATFYQEKDLPLADRINMAYASTLVTYGHGEGVVVAIGMQTEIGTIASLINEQVEEKTPLQEKLDSFGKLLGMICIAVSVIVFGLGLLRGDNVLEIFMVAVSLAVAAIPEGLPAVVTIVLALGMQKMVKKNAIMKRLSAVETLGSTTVICSDKTGTLTQNKMFVKQIYDLNHIYDVSGIGYHKEGMISFRNKPIKLTENLKRMMEAALYCNDAKVNNQENSIIGDPTEAALLVMAQKAGYNMDDYISQQRIKEFPFDSQRKRMSVAYLVENTPTMYTKGAVDELLEVCSHVMIKGEIKALTNDMKEDIKAQNNAFASKALRVIGYAYKIIKESSDISKEEKDLIFVGFSGMIDPPREEVKDSIAVAHKAGIRIIMITGDHRTTAYAIGKELEIVRKESQVISGSEIDELTEEEFQQSIKDISIFARVSPEHKVRIVLALKQQGEIAAMTGDGVNDAPALKAADIGVAMGITGTDVSKEAADMILTDDNFTSIVSAVGEGRVIYANIRKFIGFLISCNIGEILIVFFAMLFGFFFNNAIVLLPIQLLWINLMTDSFPAFALGLEQAETGIMDQHPRDPKEPIIDKRTLYRLLAQALGLMVATLLSFKLGLVLFNNPVEARTMAFVTIVFGEILRAYSARSETHFLFQSNIFSNQYLNYASLISLGLVFILIYIPTFAGWFQMYQLEAPIILLSIGLSFITLIVAELSKLFILKDK